MESRKRIRALVRCFALLACALCTVGSAASRDARRSELSWQDIESRIQYGYFTEDTRALDNLSQELSTANAQDKLTSYYSGLLAYRMMQLSMSDPDGKAPGESSKARARQLVDRCVESLDGALKIQKDFAEALALQSACLGMAADLEFWRAPFSGSRSGAQLRRALELAPDNPRVLFLQAVVDYERSDNEARTLQELKKAIAAFEAERRGVEHVPGWGAADAYCLLARIYLEQGEALPARDALEHALLLAPEFAQARRLLLRITS